MDRVRTARARLSDRRVVRVSTPRGSLDHKYERAYDVAHHVGGEHLASKGPRMALKNFEYFNCRSNSDERGHRLRGSTHLRADLTWFAALLPCDFEIWAPPPYPGTSRLLSFFQ